MDFLILESNVNANMGQWIQTLESDGDPRGIATPRSQSVPENLGLRVSRNKVEPFVRSFHDLVLEPRDKNFPRTSGYDAYTSRVTVL